MELASILRRANLASRVARILGGIAAIYVALAVYKRAIFPAVDHLFHPNGLWFATIAPLGSLVAAAAAYWGWVRLTERRTVAELAFRPVAIAAGALTGAALIALTIATLYLTNHVVVDSYRGFGQVGPIVGLIVAAAVIEEFMFRGLLFRILEEQFGTWRAGLGVALLFGVFHAFNPGATLLTILSVSLLGAFWCGIFVASRNLWVVGFNHVAWNLSIFLSGVPLSGQEDWRISAPWATRVTGPAWLTGASFGPEDSVITIGLLGVVIWLMWRALERRHLIFGRQAANSNEHERGWAVPSRRPPPKKA